MDAEATRQLVILAIFLGVVVRTAVPYARKLYINKEMIVLEAKWLGTAIMAFLSSWGTIVILIPQSLAPELQIMAAFMIAIGEHSLINEGIKWGPLTEYLKKGDVEDEDVS